MSHVTKLTGVVISDLRAVRAAVAELVSKGVSITLVENEKPRVHGYDEAPICDYVLKLSGQYDVGLKKNDAGAYEPYLDVYQHHVANAGLGALCPMPGTAGYLSQEATQHEIGRFLQMYAKHAAMLSMTDQGHVVSDCYVMPDNSIQLVFAVNG